jgi:branched-chain amino acid transport system substrate-binding protein
VSFLIRILLLLCAAAPAWGQQGPILVGAAVPESGALASLAADYRKALLLWQDEVNAAGGLLGRRVELRLHDDNSDAVRTGQLYAQLIREDKADLLIGPYGSAATLMALAEAERAQRVLINGAGASRAVHKRAPRYVFQTTQPTSSYGTGVLELAKDGGHKSVYILARDDPASREMGEAAREAALKRGLKSGELEIYSGGAEDFAVQIGKATAAGAEAWIAFGEPRNAAGMVRSFKKLGYAPRLFFVRSASDPKFIELVGQDAEFALGTKQYDAKFKTPGNDQFAPAFAAKWSAPPGVAAAEGYAAATVLAAAVRRAGTLDQAKLRATLAQMETDTVLGGYKVDAQSGEQIAARPAVVQILKGKAEVVWPQALQTAKPEPYAPWSERRTLKK